MITAAQLRAARGMLDWTRSTLAKASGLSAETIKNIEHGIYTPQESSIDAIVRAFAEHDIEFTDGDGVRKNLETVIIYQGTDGFRNFMDDVYMAASSPEARENGKKPICVSNVNDKLFVKHLGSYTQHHVNRMNKLRKVKVRVLTGEEDFYRAPETSYIEYRWSRQKNMVDVPFYVYGDKFAILIFKDNKRPRVVVVNSALVAQAYREQFDVLWKNSEKTLS